MNEFTYKRYEKRVLKPKGNYSQYFDDQDKQEAIAGILAVIRSRKKRGYVVDGYGHINFCG